MEEQGISGTGKGQTQLTRSHDLSLCLTLNNRTYARKPYFGDLTPDPRCSKAMLRALMV